MPMIDLSNDDSSNSDDSSAVVLPHAGLKQHTGSKASSGDTISIPSTDSEDAVLPLPRISIERLELPSTVLRIPAALVPAGDLEIQVSLQGSVAPPQVKVPAIQKKKVFTPAPKKCKINVLSSFSFPSLSTASTSKASASQINMPSQASVSSTDQYLVVISSTTPTAIYRNPSNNLIQGVKANPICVYCICSNLEDAVDWFKLSIARN